MRVHAKRQRRQYNETAEGGRGEPRRTRERAEAFFERARQPVETRTGKQRHERIQREPVFGATEDRSARPPPQCEDRDAGTEEQNVGAARIVAGTLETKIVRALPALEFAAADNQFVAQYTLAQLYADNSGPETDHAKAYMLYQTIADEHSDADPDDDSRAPYIAKALTALAGYLRVGIPEIGLKPDIERAADYLHHAALFFGDEDAQFELVKLKLKGEGIPEDIASAKHWLAVLTQRGHAGAQAFLADLYWRGKVMEQDKVRAFALITVAVEHAPPRERIWIEDVYQNIFCGAGEGIRRQATGMVADWRTRYGRKAEDSHGAGLDPLYPLAVRTCQNGDKVTPLTLPALQAAQPQTATAPVPSGLASA